MAEQKDKQQQKQINIELDEKTAEGIYSNLAIINHSVSEFVVDFISIMPGRPKAKVKSRIVLTPQHAKKFLKALNENVQRFEQAHGTIQDYDQPTIPMSSVPPGKPDHKPVPTGDDLNQMHIHLDKKEGAITIKDGTRTTYFVLKALMVLNVVNAGLFLYKGSRTGYGFIEVLWGFLAVVSLLVFVYLVYRKSTQTKIALNQILDYRGKSRFGRMHYALRLRNGKSRDLGTFKAPEDMARFRQLMAAAAIPEKVKS